MRHAPSRLRLLLPAAVFGLVLAACGGEDAAPAAEGAAAPAAPASDQPAQAAADGRAQARAEGRSARREARRDAAGRGGPEAGEGDGALSRAEAREQAMRERAAWWEDEALAAELGLDPAQQQALGETAARFASQREAVREQRRAGERAFRDAMDRGDLDAARLAVDDLANAAAEQERVRRLRQLGLMEVLDAGQRQQLAARGGGRMAAAMQRVRERAQQAGDADAAGDE